MDMDYYILRNDSQIQFPRMTKRFECYYSLRLRIQVNSTNISFQMEPRIVFDHFYFLIIHSFSKETRTVITLHISLLDYK